MARTLRTAFVALAMLGSPAAFAQGGAAPSGTEAAPPQTQAAPRATAEQLDQMLAPIALYPDELLGDILMASTYPLEVVEASRWLQDPGNAALKGDQLAAALEKQTWDPSVKSLAPFPRILRMMDAKLDWTERLGEAFLAEPAALMDSIQRLRRRARAAGRLVSTPQAVVTTQEDVITIEPPGPETVYVPVCDPSVVYGGWPYAAYPPDYYPGFFEGAAVGAFGCGWFGEPIIAPLWGWHRWNWRQHRIELEQGRFAALDQNRPPIGGGIWEHEPSHRHNVPYLDMGTRSRYPGVAASPESLRGLRGYPVTGVPRVSPVPLTGPALSHPSVAPNRAETTLPARPVPPSFESFGRGMDVRRQEERGFSSRMSPPPGFARPYAPQFGGGVRSGGGMRTR